MRHSGRGTKADSESVVEGNSADFIRTVAAGFGIGQLQDWGLPSESTTRWLGHLAAFEVSLCVCMRVCVCVRERV